MRKNSVHKTYEIPIRKPLKKIRASFNVVQSVVVISLIISFLATLSTIGRTVAFYYDRDTSRNNLFSADILDFETDASGSWPGLPGEYNFASGSHEIYLRLGDSYEQKVKLDNINGAGFKYKITTYKVSGPEPVCQNLLLKANIEGNTVYDENLLAFTSQENNFNGASDDWSFMIYLPVSDIGAQDGQFCEFAFLFKGWQDNLLNFPFGFNDAEKIINKVIFRSDIEFGTSKLSETQSLLGPLTENTASPSVEGLASPSFEDTPVKETETTEPDTTPIPTETPEPTPEPVPTLEPTPTPTPTPEATPTPTPESTPAQVPSETPAITPEPPQPSSNLDQAESL